MQKRMKRMAENKKKLVAYLFRKGFDYSSIQRVIGRLNIDEDYD